jgi:hypothetical protein
VFTYWDYPLSGLIKVREEYQVCILATKDRYKTTPIELDAKCLEFLEDYKKAYLHLFYENGKRITQYKGESLKWFEEKWNHQNPIMEKANGLSRISAK